MGPEPGQGDIFGKAAVAVNANGHIVLTQVDPAPAARITNPATDVGIAGYPAAQRLIPCDHKARKLMAQGDRWVSGEFTRKKLPVCAANPGSLDLDQILAHGRHRLWQFDQTDGAMTRKLCRTYAIASLPSRNPARAVRSIRREGRAEKNGASAGIQSFPAQSRDLCRTERKGQQMNANLFPARTPDHPVASQFVARWSPRAFAAQPLTEAQVLTVLEAARWAPSANNNQPWRFAYALRGDEGFAAIARSLSAGNRLWAEQAAALVVVVSATTVQRNGVDVPNATHAFDTGAAWAQLALQAHLSGWISHAMGGFDHDTLRSGLNVPAACALHAVVALGHPGDPATLPEALRAREMPNQRRPLSETARRGGF